tara:strand:- start:84 stop:209 length:126 start_codon:yes stop_codon:yes gene_type:complete
MYNSIEINQMFTAYVTTLWSSFILSAKMKFCGFGILGDIVK